jgi:hypothetical protein
MAYTFPWSNRTSLAPDLVVGFVLVAVEVIGFVGSLFAQGMRAWAAQGEGDPDSAQLQSIATTEHFLYAALALVVLAALFRAPWAMVLQLLVVCVLAAGVVYARHDYDRSHPEPVPAPSAGYSPCYSGSGRCN